MGNFKDFDKEAKEHGISSTGYFKPPVGSSTIRILSSYEILAYHWDSSYRNGPGKRNGRSILCVGKEKGCPFHGDNVPDEIKKTRIAYIAWIIDRQTASISLAELPYSVMKKISDMSKLSDYSFEGFLMPYDITITREEVGSGNQKKTSYDVIASRSNTPISDAFLDEFNLKEDISDVAEKRKQKVAESYKTTNSSDDDITLDEMYQ